LLRLYLLLFVLISLPPFRCQGQATSASGIGRTHPKSGQNPQAIFAEGQTALESGDLAKAEREFRRVLAIDPQAAAAYANLGVVNMRRQQWDQAIRMFKKAQKLAPQMSGGIELNIGLANYRQNKFDAAIAPFEAVLRDQPDSAQARYLLGLCYFFTERYEDAANTLQPLWGQESLNMNYLYVLGLAAHKSGRKELDERAMSRLIEVGQNTPEFHLLMGKAALNNGDNDKALAELQAAAAADPKLPFVHYNLGLAYLNKQDYEHAGEEFRRDLANEPDAGFSYDKLGTVNALQQQDGEAEKNFQTALRLDPKLVTSHIGLAKIYTKQGKYPQALTRLQAAEELSPTDYTVHNLRGQIFQRMGQRENAKAEFETYTRMMNAAREKRGKELSGESPDPQLTAEPE
jgi:tetratricopeptide (TPR) repeat protein